MGGTVAELQRVIDGGRVNAHSTPLFLGERNGIFCVPGNWSRGKDHWEVGHAFPGVNGLDRFFSARGQPDVSPV